MNIYKTAAVLTSALALSGCVGSAIEEAILAEIETQRNNPDRDPVELPAGLGEKTEDGVATTLADTDIEDYFNELLSDDDDDGDDGDGDDIAELDEDFRETAEELLNDIAALSATPFTTPSDLPTSGTATYDGLLSLGEAIGTMELIADFSDASLGGSVSDITIYDGTATTGSLTIASGENGIDRTADVSVDYTFSANLTGELTAPGDDGEIESYDVQAAMLGDFTGDNHGHVEGIVEGKVFENGTSEDDAEFLDGIFVGEKR